MEGGTVTDTAIAGFVVAQLEATPVAPAAEGAAPAAEGLGAAPHGELAGAVVEEHAATEEHGGAFPPFDSTYFAS